MGQGKSIGEFDIASILNMTVTPVNEAVIDSKKGKGNKTQKTEITIKGGKDIAKVAKESGKQINSVQKAIGKVTKAPVEFVPDTSKVDNAKKKLARPTESKVKLKTEKVNLPLLGKTPVKSSIDKDSRTAIKKTLSAAEETSKNLIDAAKEVVKKIGSANYLEELTKNEQQSVSNAVAKVKRNNPGISEDKLKTFEQNLTLDRRAKKTHDTLSENFRIPSSSSKAYGQEMYEAAIAAAKIQAAVKIREGLHKDEGYTQFLSENDKKKNFNGSTLKLPDKFIDQIQTGLYEHFGVGKLGTALASGKNWTGIQDRMSQSVESFSTGLASAIDATIPKTSTGKPIIKKFQQRIDSAVNTAVGMSVDNAMDYLRGIKGTKESKKALSLLGKKKNGTYEYSIDDIYDILSQKAPTGRNAANKEEAENGVNYKGLSEFLAALQVYKRSGASELNANDVSRLFELANEITTWFNDSNYDAKTVLDSINSALDQAQIEAEKMAKEQPKIEEKPKSKKSNKSSKKSSSTTPQIEEKKIKETAKTEPKKVEKKIEQKQDKQDKADEIKEPKLEKKDEFVSPVPNRSKYKVIKPSNKLKSNSIISYKDGNHYIVSGEKAPDYIYKKFETPSITSKSQESEKDNDTIKEVLLETDGESIKKDKMPKKSKKEKSDNGKLYPTANVPDDFSGLKQLSQRESAAGKKLVKTYQDIDKSIITLTQTYEENEETGASGWKNSVSRYSDFKALGTEATKITNKILQQKADLDTEMSKPDDKRNQNKIKELKENIKANQADRREIANIARSIANDTSNDYKFSDFVDAVSKGSREQRNALNATKKTNSQNIKTRNFTDQYKEAIADVKELGKAYTTLQNTILNPKGSIYKKKDGKLGSSYEDSIDQQLQSIEEKEKKIESFNENVHNKNKTSPSKIADQKIYDSYEEELQKGQSQRGQFDDNLVSLLRSAYQTRSDAQNEMLKIIGNANKSGKINKAAYEKQQEKFEKSDYAYNLLKDKVSKRQGLFDTLWSYKDDRWGNIEDRNSILQSNFDTLAKQINDYVLSIEKAGKASDQFKKDFGGIQSDLSKNDPTQFKDSKEGMKEYLDFMTDIQSRFNTNKDFYENGFGKSSLDYEAIKNKLIKSENYDTKTNDYKSKVSGFVEQWNGIIDSYNSGDIEKMKEAEHAAASLISTMNDFYKESSKSDKYKKTTSKGTLVEDTVGKVQDINDAKQSLKQFTDEMQLTNKISETIDTSTGKITQKFKDDYSGNIITITSNIDKLNNALRTTQKIQSSGSGGSGSLLGGLKNLVSGNFKSIVGEIGNSVANVQILGQAFQQMKDGFKTFLDFNKGLTNISYTMDMSKEQLSSLGSSAVDMAKDLSMSLDNTMDIYQIYANMNTTSKEIQETAKPTAILSNLSGVDASTAADQVQGILQQFHMLEDGSTTAADASMHVVDVLDKISGAVGMDYAKGIKVMTDAVQASGQVAFDAGMSYEQLAAISAKVAERTREDGSSIGNALKTIITRTTKVGKMPQYADEVDNATLSNASESLHSVGIDVYNPDGSDRGIITVLSELKAKWDDLSDAQQAKIAFDVAATRQTSKFKSILDAFSESMTLAGEATTTSGNAEANQEKYMESFSGKIQAIKTQMDEFWLNFYNSDQVSGALDFVQGLTKGFTGLEEAIGPIPTLITAVFSALTVKNAATKGLEFLVGKDGQASGLANAVG